MEKHNDALKQIMKQTDQESRIPESDFSWTKNVMKNVRASSELSVKPIKFPLALVLVFASIIFGSSILYWNASPAVEIPLPTLPDLLPNNAAIYFSLLSLSLFIIAIFIRQARHLKHKNFS